MPQLAMFPLGIVLVPGGVLPLHVFEPRYRQLVIDCLSADGPPEFGQALITHGREAGGGDERAMVGTVARMIEIDALDESRYALVAAGVRRIRINEWLPDDPYPIADVDDWPDLDDRVVADAGAGTPASFEELLTATHHRVFAAMKLAARVEALTIDVGPHAGVGDAGAGDGGVGDGAVGDGGVADDGLPGPGELPAISDDPSTATFHLAAMAPIGPADRYRLLTATGPQHRLEVLGDALDDVEAMLKFRLT